MSTRKNKITVEVAEVEVINSIEVEPVTTSQDNDGLTINGAFFPVTVLTVDSESKKEVSGYTKRMADGETFTGAEIAACERYSREFNATATLYKAKVAEMKGEENALFQPFAQWAETLCTDKNGKLILSAGNGDAKLETVNAGILFGSMLAVLSELTDGRSGKKAVKFAARNSRKAVNFEMAGRSEEITAAGLASVIGQDNSGDMLALLDRLHTATDRVVSTSLNDGKDKANGFASASALVESQIAYTNIPAASFAAVIQAATFGRYVAENSQLAKAALAVVTNGSRFAGSEKIN